MQALISVFDKRGIVEFSRKLTQNGYNIISTGGTAKKLTDEGISNTPVSDITNFPELLDGRVKTLHPNIHAALLARMELPEHVKELEAHHIKPIQLVVVNLYPFQQATADPSVTLETALENIDIGGVTLIRASAKNFKNVVVVIDPNDYGWILEKIFYHGISAITLEERRLLAVKAFEHVVKYDTAISKYLKGVSLGTEKKAEPTTEVVRKYEKKFDLKYGCNPHQSPASVLSIEGLNLPFKVLNGVPGYINLMDALNAWQLVKELREATGLPAAASFKHVSPAGAAVAVPLTDKEKEVYEIAATANLTPQAVAYIRARNADPLCSFGDFAALSDVVDEATALTLKTEVSDGIIAPGFEDKALEILKQKKNGAYIVIQSDPSFQAPDLEYREIHGCVLSQKRNSYKITKENFTKIVTKTTTLSEGAVRDLIVATITMKYTQSNSVGYAKNGQMIGVGAGQQSRVDCTKLAGSKVGNWHSRFHPKVLQLPFKSGTKRTEKTNARIHFIEGNFEADLPILENRPESLTKEEKDLWMKELSEVACSSDAFFPFRDSIDVMKNYGVKYVAQPGGSVQDESVTTACDEFGMTMAFTGVRLFHH